MSQWFLIRNGQQHGPITDQQLKDLAAKGRIQPTDQVRRDDMAAPVLAGTIRGLAFAAPPVTPPAPQPASTPEDPSKAALSGLLTFCLIIGISGFVIYRVVTKNSGKKAAAHQGLPDLKDVPEGDLIFADRLYSQYQGNEVGADQQYKGKTIVVFGDVASVESPPPEGKFDSVLNGTVINFNCRGSSQGVRCVLSDAAVKSGAIANIWPGQMIKARGYCYGKHRGIWVVLGDCEFMVFDR